MLVRALPITVHIFILAAYCEWGGASSEGTRGTEESGSDLGSWRLATGVRRAAFGVRWDSVEALTAQAIGVRELRQKKSVSCWLHVPVALV
jgi:hypothetical protein